MKILVVGAGGREHAICAALGRSELVSKIYCAPGNPGVAQIAQCVPIAIEQIYELATFAVEEALDMTFVGGETSLALGVVDEFESRGLRIVGPRRIAAQLEASKAFAKDFMNRHGIPTAQYEVASNASEAIQVLESETFGDADAPVVIKADGLAAGKGVVVATNRAEAASAVMGMRSLAGDAAGEKIVIEECLVGHEVSLLMFVSGEDYILMPPTRDHKRIGDGDTGPNTGGMGTITDTSLLTLSELQTVIDEIIVPTLRGCTAESMPFSGILFLGLMMTASGPKLLEYNMRFGDPETQAILVRLDTDLAAICTAMVDGNLSSIDARWKAGASACIVLAAEGYPTKAKSGDEIEGIALAEAATNVTVYQAGTATNQKGKLVTSGGRVLGVTAVAENLREALSSAYSAVESIHFDGMHFRRDIGKNA